MPAKKACPKKYNKPITFTLVSQFCANIAVKFLIVCQDCLSELIFQIEIRSPIINIFRKSFDLLRT